MSNFQHLDELLQSFVEKEIVGCGCIVAKEGQILYENYAGYANREQGTLMSKDSVHRLYSTTKVIVCTAAMLLYERGKFLLNDPVSNYLPQFKHAQVLHTSPNGFVSTQPAKSPMLVKHLFTMTSGLAYDFPGPANSAEMANKLAELKRNGNYTLEQLVDKLAEVPLLFEPGTHWMYGFSHDVLARLVEVVSGQSIDEFVEQELLIPLGMTDSGYRFKGDIKSRLVPLYSPNEQNELVQASAAGDEHFVENATMNFGGIGLYSTVRDYTKFAQMMANGGVHEGTKIIGRPTIDLIRANHLNELQLKEFTNPYSAGYGYGLGVRTLINPTEAHYGGNVGEFGWTGMSGTYALIDPAEKLSIVYMHQRIPNMELEHHLRLRNAVYGCL